MFKLRLVYACSVVLAVNSVLIPQCLGHQQQHQHEDSTEQPRGPRDVSPVDSLPGDSHLLGVIRQMLAAQQAPVGEPENGREKRRVVLSGHDEIKGLRNWEIMGTNAKKLHRRSGGYIAPYPARLSSMCGEIERPTTNLPHLLNVNCVDSYPGHFHWPDRLQESNIFHRLYHPLTLPEPVKIKEHPHIDGYDAVMTFGRPENQKESMVLYAMVVDVPKSTKNGQTWRVHDMLNFSRVEHLPEECLGNDNFLPSIALTQSQDRIIFYNFGYQPACSKLAVYNPGSRHLHMVESSHGALQIPNLFTSLSFVAFEGRKGPETLLLFGGLYCNQTEVRKCNKASNKIFRFDFTNKHMTQGEWKPFNSSIHRSSVPLSARFSATLFAGPRASDNTGIIGIYGGISITSGSKNTSYKPECDLWLLNSTTHHWMRVANLDHDCGNRTNLSCLGPKEKAGRLSTTDIPLRPICAYSKARQEVVVLTMPVNIIPSLLTLRCVVEGFRISKYSLSSSRPAVHWRSLHTANMFQLGSYISNAAEIFSASIVVSSLSETITLVTKRSLEVVLFLPGRFPENDTIKSHRIYDVDYEYRFAGSEGCETAAPIEIDTPYPGMNIGSQKSFLFLGGSCQLSAGKGDTTRFPVWTHMPIWIYFKDIEPQMTGRYQMRIVSPSPRHPRRTAHTVTRITDEWAVLYGGFSIKGEDVGPELWCFNFRHFYWLNASVAGETVPNVNSHAYAGHVAYPLTGETPGNEFVIYGGFVIYQTTPPPALVKNHMYVFRFTNLSACEGKWTNVTDNVPSGPPLPARALHSATNFRNQIFIYGGVYWGRGGPAVSPMLFTLSVTGGSDYIVHWTQIQLSPSRHGLFGHTLSEYSGGMMILLGGAECISKRCNSSTAFLLKLSDSGANGTLTPFFTSSSPFAFHRATKDGYVFGGMSLASKKTFGGLDELFKSRRCFRRIPSKHCPLGQQLNGDICEDCPINYSSPTLKGNCSRCTGVMRTHCKGSPECLNPDPCSIIHYCHGRGVCHFDHITKKFSCNCTTSGYWNSNNCFAPLTQIISVACVLFPLALGFFIVAVIKRVKASRRLSRKRKEDLKLSRRKLEELANGVIIEWGDLKFVDVLGQGSSGNVCLAQFGDMQVAVKTLRHYSDNVFLKNFSKEIESMRTVRHSNIVMFLGAGTMPQTHVPFIVMEYATRGSLFQLLHNRSITISHIDRMTFALDTARGMEYLHGMKTPRLHCDLKSSNLLVTGAGAIKIADFGMLRLVSTIRRIRDRNEEDENVADEALCSEDDMLIADYSVRHRSIIRKSQHRGCSSEPSSPLVFSATGSFSQETLTDALGTSRWCSPETLRSGVFNKYTDVYSYGVVLWEVLTRDIPFGHRQEEREVAQEIRDGAMLPIPPCAPEGYEYRRLMEMCWDTAPEKRPLFPAIVLRLEDQMQHFDIPRLQGGE